MFIFQDYETDLAAYSSGLETLLNIPVKRTMIKSPSMDLNQEVLKCEDEKKRQVSWWMFAEGLVIFFLFPLQATQLQTRYMELLTLSGDYYRFLGDLLKNMEQLKVFIFLLNVSDAFKYRHMLVPKQWSLQETIQKLMIFLMNDFSFSKPGDEDNSGYEKALGDEQTSILVCSFWSPVLS